MLHSASCYETQLHSVEHTGPVKQVKQVSQGRILTYNLLIKLQPLFTVEIKLMTLIVDFFIWMWFN